MSTKYRVVVTAPAEADLFEIADYIAADDQDAAFRWLDEMQAKIDTLKRFPSRAPVIPEAPELGAEHRHILYGDYRAIFRIEDDRVVVLRVVHGSRLLDASALSEM